MAASTGRRLQKKIVELDLQFDGVVQSSVRARLTAEVLKYLFHQRGQIPLSYELVKRDVDSAEKQSTTNEHPAKRIRLSLNERRRKLAMTALDSIMKIMDDIFNSGHPVKEVLFIFGSTIMTPKEVYRLRFPVKCYEGKVLSWTSCRMALFQKLVSSDVFGDARPLRAGTKLSVLVLTPRASCIGTLGLVAKPMFKLTHRGCHFEFNFDFTGQVVNPDLSCAADASFDISGVEALNMESPVLDLHSTPLPASRMANSQHQTPLTSHSSSGQRTRKGRYSGGFPGLRSSKYSRLCSVEESPIKSDNADAEPGFNIGNVVDSEEVEGNEHYDNDPMSEVVIQTEGISITGDNHNNLNNTAVQSDYVWFQLPVTATGYKERKGR